MVVSNSSDIFLQKMNDLFQGFEFIRSYIYDLFVLKKVYWIYHVYKLELTLNKLKEIGLKYNIENYFFGKTKMEYLCFWLTHNGIKHIDNKIEVMDNMTPPTNQEVVCKFIGLLNYHRNIWTRHSHMV